MLIYGISALSFGQTKINEKRAAYAALLRFRGSHDPIVAASWLSARNSALIIALESAITLVLSSSGSQWPENLIGTLEAILTLQAAIVVAREAWA